MGLAAAGARGTGGRRGAWDGRPPGRVGQRAGIP